MTLIDNPRVGTRRGGWGVPRRFVAGRALRAAAVLVPMILAEVSEVGDPLVLGGVTAASWTITGTATFLLGLPGGRPELVLRMSRTGAGRLRHESAVLAALTEGPGLTAVRDFLPTRRGEGAV
ncbi:MAG: hypothetical protein QOJ68_3484, partial [Blastococcus sp.]|nr:hypothetical protein [Blastococcus sp.]